MRVLALLAAVATAQAPAPPGKLVDVGGYRVHLNCTGAGRPTVFVAGAGFSSDWGLVQPEVARFTTICTYDVSGTAWSDPGTSLNCRERVNEVHKLVREAHVQEPLVLVGLSIGACVARLYAAEYPTEVAGLVLVDYAFSPDRDPPPSFAPRSDGVTMPVLIQQTPIDLIDLTRLPESLRQQHDWAMSLHPKLPTWEDA